MGLTATLDPLDLPERLVVLEQQVPPVLLGLRGLRDQQELRALREIRGRLEMMESQALQAPLAPPVQRELRELWGALGQLDQPEVRGLLVRLELLAQRVRPDLLGPTGAMGGPGPLGQPDHKVNQESEDLLDRLVGLDQLAPPEHRASKELTEPTASKVPRVPRVQRGTLEQLALRGRRALQALLVSVDQLDQRAIQDQLVLLEHSDLQALQGLEEALVQLAPPVLLAKWEQQARRALRGLRVLTEMMERLAPQGRRVARGLQVLRDLLALPEPAQRVLLGLPATPGPLALQDPQALLEQLGQLDLLGLEEALGLPDQPG